VFEIFNFLFNIVGEQNNLILIRVVWAHFGGRKFCQWVFLCVQGVHSEKSEDSKMLLIYISCAVCGSEFCFPSLGVWFSLQLETFGNAAAALRDAAGRALKIDFQSRMHATKPSCSLNALID